MMPALSATSRIMKIGLTSERARPDRAVVDLVLEDPPAPAARARCGRRRHLRRAAQAAPRPGRPGAAGEVRHPDRHRHGGRFRGARRRRAAVREELHRRAGRLRRDRTRSGSTSRTSSRSPAAEELAKVPVAERDGKVLRMADLGTVKQDSMQLWGEGVINDGDGLMLIVQKYRGANTKEVTDGRRGDDGRDGPGPPRPSSTTRPSSGRRRSSRSRSTTSTMALLLGVLLVIVIISGVPLHVPNGVHQSDIDPVVVARRPTYVLDLRDVTINVMVLAGLVVAIGVVVDDAIIDVENIVRRLRQARAKGATSRRADRARGLGRDPQRHHLRHDHQRRRDRAGALPRRTVRVVLPAARAVVRPRRVRLDARRDDGDACALPAPAAPRRLREKESPLLRVLKRWLHRCARTGGRAILLRRSHRRRG